MGLFIPVNAFEPILFEPFSSIRIKEYIERVGTEDERKSQSHNNDNNFKNDEFLHMTLHFFLKLMQHLREKSTRAPLKHY